MSNDIGWQAARQKLSPSAQKAIDWISQGPLRESIREEFLLNACDYLQHHDLTVKGLMADLPLANDTISLALNICLWQHYSVSIIWTIAKHSNASISSPATARKALNGYAKSIDIVADLHGRLTSTSVLDIMQGALNERAKAAAEIRQILLEDLLKSLLPTEHFEAVKALGIDADKWSDAGDDSYTKKLRNHAHKTRLARDGLSTGFQSVKAPRPDTDILVSDLADIWQAGTGKRASAARNNALELSTPFYRFFLKAWGEICEDVTPPSPDTVARALKRKSLL